MCLYPRDSFSYSSCLSLLGLAPLIMLCSGWVESARESKVEPLSFLCFRLKSCIKHGSKGTFKYLDKRVPLLINLLLGSFFMLLLDLMISVKLDLLCRLCCFCWVIRACRTLFKDLNNKLSKNVTNKHCSTICSFEHVGILMSESFWKVI